MTRILILIAAGIAFSTAAFPVAAQPFEEGRHFHAIGSPSTPPADRVEVVEAFAYPCPACRAFMPVIRRWSERLPEQVQLTHLPVPLQAGWDTFALVYHTAEVLGLGHDAHEAMFVALHDQARPFRTLEDIAAVYTPFGVTVEDFISTSQSFAVDSRVRRSRNDVMRFGIRGTPSMVVQGKWRLSPTNFSSYEELLAAVDYLVARELALLDELAPPNGVAE